jgi:HK97 family phage major capsid protein
MSEVDDPAGDEPLRGLLEAEDTAKGVLADVEDRRNTLLHLLSRNPVATEIGGTQPQDLVSAMMEDPAFQNARRVAAGSAAIGVLPTVAINSRAALVRSLRNGGYGFLAVGEGATGEALIAIDQNLFPPVEIPRRQIRLLDLITVGATDSNLVRYGKQTVRTDTAAPTALATAFPAATYTWSTADAAVENIGQYVKAPRESLLDIPALQTLIEQQLVYGVLLEAETEVYSGGGTGQDFTGITTEVTKVGYSGAYVLTKETNERRVSVVSRAIANVRTTLYQDPDAVVMHPVDYHNMLVEESTAGGFLLANSRTPAESNTIWGLPVVATPLASEGTILVGNFKLGATMWVRSGAELQMSDSNEDDFLKRLIAIRAEFRAAFACQRPHAFCVVEGF